MSNFFRIDDVSINTNHERFRWMVSLLREKFPDCRIMAVVSPCVHTQYDERVFPLIMNREPDFRVFYRSNQVGVPRELMKLVDEAAAHGIVHVDHRLLERAAQELSVVLSCSLVGTSNFYPPFHKFNHDTEEACSEHGIRLIKLHDRMTHLKFHKVAPERDYYYFHTHDFPEMDTFKKQLGA